MIFFLFSPLVSFRQSLKECLSVPLRIRKSNKKTKKSPMIKVFLVFYCVCVCISFPFFREGANFFLSSNFMSFFSRDFLFFANLLALCCLLVKLPLLIASVEGLLVALCQCWCPFVKQQRHVNGRNGSCFIFCWFFSFIRFRCDYAKCVPSLGGLKPIRLSTHMVVGKLMFAPLL